VTSVLLLALLLALLLVVQVQLALESCMQPGVCSLSGWARICVYETALDYHDPDRELVLHELVAALLSRPAHPLDGLPRIQWQPLCVVHPIVSDVCSHPRLTTTGVLAPCRAMEVNDVVGMLQVKRTDLEDWMKQPHLDETLLGAIVRVALSTNVHNEANYGMCLVHDVTDGQRYTCAPSPTSPFSHVLACHLQLL
jgi:hypothetical protein